MGVIRYDITEEALNEQRLPLTELSILTGVDSSSYLITDSERNVLAIRAFTHPVTEAWWKTDARLGQSFAKTRLAWLGRRFTLVPARLYNVEARRNMLEELTDLQAGDTVLADALPELDAYLVYALSQEQLDTWRRAYVGCRFYHGLTPILCALAQESRRFGKARVYAYLRDGLLYTVAIERERLLFCNVFSCPASKDYLYYVLLTYEQCGWKPAQVSLRIFGEVLTSSEVFKLFYRYVHDVQVLPNSFQLHVGSQADEHPAHLFYDLFSLQQYH